MSPEEILARVAATYANAPRYEDTGVMMVLDGRGEFRTSFVRDEGRLLFEGRIADHDYALEARGGEIVRSDARHSEMSVGHAIASLTGVTFGAAFVVPRLLWPDVVGGTSIIDGSASVLRESSERIELLLTENVPTQLVIDARNWLITSVEIDLGDLATVSISYKPSL